MKIKPEHIAFIQEKFRAKVGEIVKHRAWLKIPSNSVGVKDFEKRLRWDAFNSIIGSNWICEKIYPYANDEHLDTALRHVFKELGLDKE